MIYQFFTIRPNDCGFIALKMLLANTNKDKKYEFLVDQKPNNEAYSLKELQDISSEHGLVLSGFEASRDNFHELKLPLILIYKIPASDHAVYVYKITKNKVYFINPTTGKKESKFFDDKAFDNFYLLQIKSHQIHQFNDAKKHVLVQPSFRLLTIFFHIISFLLLFAAFYYFSIVDGFLHGILLVFTSILLEFSIKIIILNASNKFDQFQLFSRFSFVRKRQDFYELGQKVKMYILTKDTIIFSTFSMIIFLLYIAYNTGLFFLILAIVTILFSGLISFLSNRFFKPKKEKLFALEQQVFRSNDGDFLSLHQQIKKETNIIFLMSNLFKIIVPFIGFVAYFIYAFIVQTFIIGEVFFLFLIVLTLQEKTDSFFKYQFNVKENRKNMILFRTRIF